MEEHSRHFGLFWNLLAWVFLWLMLLGLLAKIGEVLIKLLRKLPPLPDTASSPEDFSFMRSWPAPVRWLSLLPGCALAFVGWQLLVMFFAAFMFKSAQDDFGIPVAVPYLIAKIVASCLSGFWFVLVGAKIAPAAKTKVALGLALLCGTTSIVLPAYYALRGAMSLSIGDIIAMLVTAAAATFAYIEVQRHSFPTA